MEAPASAVGTRAPDPEVPDARRFWEELRLCMPAFSPAPRDRELERGFESLRLLAGESPYRAPAGDPSAALRDGAKQGDHAIHEVLTHCASANQNGWKPPCHPFDFNVDSLELGTIDAPSGGIAERPNAIAERAAAALGGMWGNHGYEAACAMTWTTATALSSRQPGPTRCDCSRPRRSTRDGRSPCTICRTSSFPIERHSIGDRTPPSRRSPHLTCPGYCSVAHGAATARLPLRLAAKPEQKCKDRPGGPGETAQPA